jgi:hypothetical protein
LQPSSDGTSFGRSAEQEAPPINTTCPNCFLRVGAYLMLHDVQQRVSLLDYRIFSPSGGPAQPIMQVLCTAASATTLQFAPEELLHRLCHFICWHTDATIILWSGVDPCDVPVWVSRKRCPVNLRQSHVHAARSSSPLRQAVECQPDSKPHSGTCQRWNGFISIVLEGPGSFVPFFQRVATHDLFLTAD